MSEWLRIRSVEGMSIEPDADLVLGVVMSPYSYPDAVRGVRLSGRRFRIEFRYIDGIEKGIDQRLSDHITAVFGKYSQRLLSLTVELDGTGAKTVGLQIAPESFVRQIDAAFDGMGRSHDRLHFDNDTMPLLRDAFKTRERDVFAQLQAAGH